MHDDHRQWKDQRDTSDVIEDILMAQFMQTEAQPEGPWADNNLDFDSSVKIAQINLLGSIALSLQTLNELIFRGYTLD